MIPSSTRRLVQRLRARMGTPPCNPDGTFTVGNVRPDKLSQQAANEIERLMERDRAFIRLAVAALKRHRYCGDCYPEGGWEDVNAALAAYAALKRKNGP